MELERPKAKPKIDYTETMLIISSPEDFPSWSPAQKLDRYRRVLEWHDYIAELYGKDKIPQVWGTHQLLSAATPTTSQGVLIVVYRTADLAEFDMLFDEDPLRDVSRYLTLPLTPLLTDTRDDIDRFNRKKKEMGVLKGVMKRSPLRHLVYQLERARYTGPPGFVGQYQPVEPPNPQVDIKRRERPGDPIEVLLYGRNPDELVTMWDDTRKLIHYEKVLWWHSYTAKMITEGKAPWVWGTHDFCDAVRNQAVRARALTVIRADDYDEFDELYSIDPIRSSTLFLSSVLRPIADQRVSDERRFELASKRYK